MPRCLRCGCPHPQQHPDPLGLGLCANHTNQFRAGTIGKHHNPRLREHPTTEAQQLLARITRPGDSLRTLGRRVGLPKDVIRNIQNVRYRHIRSDAWEKLQEAVADHEYRGVGQQGVLFEV